MDQARARPSRTSQAVAAWRATLPRASSPDGDADAQATLCAGMAPVRDEAMRAQLAARTRFFDDQVVDALGRGCDQVVVLGAGYDDRALRFRTPGVRFFEVDHPDTQDDKRLRLERMGAARRGPTLVPVDFCGDGLAAALDRAGHRTDRPTLVLAEGLLVYLGSREIADLLGGVRARAGAGSVLAASLAVHPEGLDSAGVTDRANAARPRAGAEPWRTILSRSAHLALVEGAGWAVVDTFDATAFDATAVPGRSLLVVAQA